MTFEIERIKVVAAIDFGTSRSGYAYAPKKEDDKKIYVRYKWDRQPFPYIKTLTQSLYNSDRQLEAWGYAALLYFVGYFVERLACCLQFD